MTVSRRSRGFDLKRNRYADLHVNWSKYQLICSIQIVALLADAALYRLYLYKPICIIIHKYLSIYSYEFILICLYAASHKYSGATGGGGTTPI